MSCAKIRWILGSHSVIIIGLIRWWFQLQLPFLKWLSASLPSLSPTSFCPPFLLSRFKILRCRIYHTYRELYKLYKHCFISDNKVYPHVNTTQDSLWTSARNLEVSHMPFSNGKPSLEPRGNHYADLSDNHAFAFLYRFVIHICTSREHSILNTT